MEFVSNINFAYSHPLNEDWMLFLSRHDHLQKLVIKMGWTDEHYHKFSSYVLSWEKLTHLELSQCELNPLTFEGFVNLRSLIRTHFRVSDSTALERIISSIPLLESLSLDYCEFYSLAINVSAPKLTYLFVFGEFKDFCLVNTPLLVKMLCLITSKDMIDQPGCRFINFFGGVPHLETLIGGPSLTKVITNLVFGDLI